MIVRSEKMFQLETKFSVIMDRKTAWRGVSRDNSVSEIITTSTAIARLAWPIGRVVSFPSPCRKHVFLFDIHLKVYFRFPVLSSVFVFSTVSSSVSLSFMKDSLIALRVNKVNKKKIRGFPAQLWPLDGVGVGRPER